MVEGEQALLAQWESLKKEERDEKNEENSLLDGVPRALPALQQAHTYGIRVARVGFDWPDVTGVVDKVREEIAELEAAETPKEVEAELGDLLFAVTNWARHLDVDPETALRLANARFAGRFGALEGLVRQRGLDLAQMTIDEMEALWQEVKRNE